jgi:tetratricopeptide (TPR) repeat protein
MIVPILPVLDVLSFREGHLVHDRYLYLPSFGFALLVALGLRHLKLGPGRLVGPRVVQLGLAGLIRSVMGLRVVRATACYVDDITFFTYVNATSPQGHNSKLDLARMLAQQGHLDETIKIYMEVLPTQPDNAELNYNLRLAYYLASRLPDAYRFLSRAAQLDGHQPNAFFYRGLTELKMGDVNGAAADVRRAIALRPDAAYYHFALGVIMKLQGDLPGALSEFREAMVLCPDEPSARQQAEEIEAAQKAGAK